MMDGTNEASNGLAYSWLNNLETTLNSVEGSRALESYLVRCGCLPLLEFIWACDGMKTLVLEHPEKADQLVSCIYKNYISSGALPILSNQAVIEIARHLENYFEKPDPSDFSKTASQRRAQSSCQLNILIFDEAKSEVEAYLRTEIFPQFQRAVNIGSVCVVVKRNGCSGGACSSSTTLASHPEAFARALCEKLEDLRITRDVKNN